MGQVGVVVIGRNEGDRLRRCLHSLEPSRVPTVYVDSASTDGSDVWASSRGVSVVALDPAIPFTAARARNSGFERLVALYPETALVLFVDGDCEVAPGWIERARAEMESDPRLGVVCGRRRERFREASIYNRLADIEWDTPTGPTKACGGDAMMRVEAFRDAGGFDARLIAGEEPELCVRLRARGWSVRRVDAEMTVHDAAMTNAGQWWRRAVRAGHSFAEGFALHGRPPERMWLRKNLSIVGWALCLPVAALAGAWLLSPTWLLLLAAYPAFVVRWYRKEIARGRSHRDARAWAISCMLSNFPHLVGQVRYVVSRMRGRPSGLIEYKGTGHAQPRT